MTGDCHVRFRENAEVKFPSVTRLHTSGRNVGGQRNEKLTIKLKNSINRSKRGLNQERMKAKALDKIRQKLFLFITFLFMLLTGCNKPKLAMPSIEDVATATIQEYHYDTPVSREIVLDKELSGYGHDCFHKIVFLDHFISNSSSFVNTKKKSFNSVSLLEKKFKIRLKLVSGEIRTLYFYGTEEQEYIEEPHFGIYVKKNLKHLAGSYSILTRGYGCGSYLFTTLNDAFGITKEDAFHALEREKSAFSILPEYNGAGKAIWMEFSNAPPDTLTTFGNNPLHFPTRFIPETRDAKRAEDVRYIAALFIIRGEYIGTTHAQENVYLTITKRFMT